MIRLKDKEYKKNREKEASKKIQSALDVIESEELAAKLITKILEKYEPEIDFLSTRIETKILSQVEEKLKAETKDLVGESISDKYREEIREMISEEMDRRFIALIKNPEDYEY